MDFLYQRAGGNHQPDAGEPAFEGIGGVGCETAKVRAKGFKVDYIGFSLVALGLGSLQVVLDKGQEDDWLSSNFILFFTIVATIGIIGVILWEFHTDDPIVDLPLLKKFNFAFTNIMMFAIGFILFGTTQLLPQYTQSLLGYTATQAGLVISPGGFAVMACMPLAGYLVGRVQAKWLIMAGMFIEGMALIYMTNFDTQVSFSTLAWRGCFRRRGWRFCSCRSTRWHTAGCRRGRAIMLRR